MFSCMDLCSEGTFTLNARDFDCDIAKKCVSRISMIKFTPSDQKCTASQSQTQTFDVNKVQVHNWNGRQSWCNHRPFHTQTGKKLPRFRTIFTLGARALLINYFSVLIIFTVPDRPSYIVFEKLIMCSDFSCQLTDCKKVLTHAQIYPVCWSGQCLFYCNLARRPRRDSACTLQPAS